MKAKINKEAAAKRLKPCICGNTDDFDLVSAQVCEDGCEIWIACGKCGHDPASECGQHVESVMGELDSFTAGEAAEVWNEHICSNKKVTYVYNRAR